MTAADAFGVELRRRRMAAGLTLHALARRVHYGAPHLSRVETGLRCPSPELARLCDVQLAAGGALAALVPIPGQLRGRHSSEDDPPPEMRVPEGRLVAGMPPLTPDVPHEVVADAATIAVLREMFGHLRRLGQVAAPAAVLPSLVERVRTLQTLAGAARGTERTDLYVLAAHHAEYAGWMAQEQGHPGAAMRWTRHAVLLDVQAGRRDMTAYAYVRQAELALYRRQPHRVTALAERARADRSVNPRIQALAAHREAQGHALAGDRPSCEAALDRAATLWADFSPQQHQRELFGSTNVSDLHAMMSGWCDLDLGRPRSAAELLAHACSRLPGTARRSRALYGARLSLAHAAAGDLDRACELAQDLLPDVRAVASASARHQLRDLSVVLRRWPRHRPAQALIADLNGVLAHADVPPGDHPRDRRGRATPTRHVR